MSNDHREPPKFDATGFTNVPYVKRYEKPWGYELHWVPADHPFLAKILHLNGGARFSLQCHESKIESWLLMSGQAKLIWDNAQGELIETELQPGQGYSINVGQRHRIQAVTDCDIVEVSTPEAGTTWRLEDDYARPDETPAERQKERGEA